MNMSKQHTKKSKRGKSRRRNNVTDGISATSNALTRLPKSVTNIVPDRMYTRLRFIGYGNLSITTITTVASARYRPSSAFDVDPLLGSTSTPGFAELAAFYSNYRTTSSRCRIVANNASAQQGALITLTPLNVDPGVSPSVAVINSWIEQPYAKSKICGTAGSPAVTIVSEMSTEKIFGSKMVYLDDNFQSLVTTSPVNNWYWAISATTPIGPSSTQTVNVLIDIELGVEFFSRKALLA